MRRLVLLISLLILISCDMKGQTTQKTIRDGIEDFEIKKILGGWSITDHSTYMQSWEYSWGLGKYINIITIVIDISESEEIIIIIPGFGGFSVERVIKLAENKYSLIVIRSNEMNPKYWPEKGSIVLTFIDSNTVEVNDSNFPIIGFHDKPGILKRIAGPDMK